MARPKRSVDVIKVCENCNNEFVVPEWEARRRDRKYCNLDCYYEHQKSFVDETFFKKPNASMAYVLGLAMADGCITKRSSGTEVFSIKSIDKEILEEIKQLMKSEYGVYFCGKSDAGNDVWRIDIANEKIVSDAKRWGIVPRKTLIVKFPNLPKKYHPDFIRGVFDGDGGVYLYDYDGRISVQVCMLGTKPLLDSIVESVGLDVKVKPYRKIAKVMFAAQGKIKKLHDFMYHKKELPCISRKRDKFAEVLEYGRKRGIIC